MQNRSHKQALKDLKLPRKGQTFLNIEQLTGDLKRLRQLIGRGRRKWEWEQKREELLKPAQREKPCNFWLCRF